MARLTKEVETVVRGFYGRKETFASNYRVDSDGNLWHYADCIATWHDGLVIVNNTYYSPTTQRLQVQVAAFAPMFAHTVVLVTVDTVPTDMVAHEMRKNPVAVRRAQPEDLVRMYRLLDQHNECGFCGAAITNDMGTTGCDQCNPTVVGESFGALTDDEIAALDERLGLDRQF